MLLKPSRIKMPSLFKNKNLMKWASHCFSLLLGRKEEGNTEKMVTTWTKKKWREWNQQ